ncbi:MAG: proline dehydrogenase family protein [Actinomycetota bacterium]|jgi:proline dehydrogenase|nr:proline dehydrogenase family protein [Actinomycetota bacterium]
MLGVPASRRVLFRLATSERWERFVRATPLGEGWAWRAARRYVAGTTRDAAFDVVRELGRSGVGTSVDQFGELVDKPVVAESTAADYLRLAGDLGALPESTWLAVDLSHLGLDIDRRRCGEHLAAIAAALPTGRRVQVGAEDHDRADAVVSCVLDASRRAGAERLGATVQANFHRSAGDLERLVDAGVHVRLVKGAYVEPLSRALPYGEATDVAYLRLAQRLADASGPFSLATHDGVLREALLAAFGPREVEQLLGVRPDVLADLATRGVPVRVYVPFGEGWFRYWMRRVAEAQGT